MHEERGFISLLALLLLAGLLLFGTGLQCFLQRQLAQNQLRVQLWRLDQLADAALLETTRQLTIAGAAQPLPDKYHTQVKVRETTHQLDRQSVQLQVMLCYQPQTGVDACYEVVSTACYRGATGIVGAERRAVLSREKGKYVWLGYVR